MEWLHILILLSWDLTVGQHETTVRLPASATSQIAKPASELSRKLTQICTWPKSTCQRKYLISKKQAGWLLGCLFLSGWSQNWEFRESSAELIVTCCSSCANRITASLQTPTQGLRAPWKQSKGTQVSLNSKCLPSTPHTHMYPLDGWLI